MVGVRWVQGLPQAGERVHEALALALVGECLDATDGHVRRVGVAELQRESIEDDGLCRASPIELQHPVARDAQSIDRDHLV